jgi:hypothetical protein
VTAQLCAEVDPYPEGCDDDTMTCTCAEAFETCGQDEPTLHEPHCRVDLAWCLVEPPVKQSPVYEDWLAHCLEVEETCPTSWAG